MERLQQDAKHMRECLSRSMSPESDQTTARGIEHLASRKTIGEIIRARENVIGAVLAEQADQRAHGVNDPTALAVASSVRSFEARKAAIAKAAAADQTRQRARADGRHCADEVRREATRSALHRR